jgi:hypothetical protein
LLETRKSIGGAPLFHGFGDVFRRAIGILGRIENQIGSFGMSANRIEVKYESAFFLLGFIVSHDALKQLDEVLFRVIREPAFDKWIVQVVTLFLM